MFESIYELPPQVRSSLDEKDQEVFMKAYNAEKPKSEEDVKKAMKSAWKACKTLPSSFSFHIIASVEDVDNDREIIGMDSIKEHMDSFIDYGGNIQNDHTSYQLGVIWDWEPIEKEGKPGIAVWGNLFGGEEVYDRARKAFIDGTNNLSIAGEASRGQFKCDDKGCYTHRDVKQLLEISLCKVPANKHCKLQWYNEDAKLTKSATEGGLRLGVEEYTVHKDYTMCPIQRLKRDLQNAGFDAHARTDGVFLAINMPDMDRTEKICKSLGLVAQRVEGGLLLNRMNSMIERVFKEGFREGYLDVNGNLTRNITKEQFFSIQKSGLLVKDGDTWSLRLPEVM